MCGLFGVVSRVGLEPSLDDPTARRLRDMLAHRGPDGAGLWRRQNVVLAHRRLAVRDLSPAGRQPMTSADGRYALVYNGELYNEEELRDALRREGVTPSTACDTETVLCALAAWGLGALERMRGMYALALYDTVRDELTLARDPLGIKPLYWWADEREIVFASEPGPIVSSPRAAARPDFGAISAYLTTIRTTLGERTLYEGVRALQPGSAAVVDLRGAALRVRVTEFWQGPRATSGSGSDDNVRAIVRDSVSAHLRSDVRVCSLLSGGLDSVIVAHEAAGRIDGLLTYCAGALPEDEALTGGMGGSDDLSWAARASEAIGSHHAEAIVTRGLFADLWPEMIARLRSPLSTPNEVAIHTVAARLRRDGCKVTLSGEGADELFAGYEGPMESAESFIRSGAGRLESGGAFELRSNAWAPLELKHALLTARAWREAEQDLPVVSTYERVFDRCVEECGEASLSAHLRFHRKINLVGLLQRLDTATMLAGVEGRTPFADVRVAEFAEALPMERKFVSTPPGAGGGTAVLSRCGTKVALRSAYRGLIGEAFAERPKASFPLPFQAWVGDHAGSLRRSGFAREVFSEAAIEAVASEPAANWRLAWPMINIALWGEIVF